MSGMSVGASGETADDMDTSDFEAKEALLITSPRLRGEVDFRARRESRVRGSHRMCSSRREAPRPPAKRLAPSPPQPGGRRKGGLPLFPGPHWVWRGLSRRA